MRYNNYHSHTHKSSIFTPDTYIKIEDYCKRIVELGHDTYFTTEHGFGGDIFEAREMCDKYGIKCKFGLEGYIVKDPLGVDENEKRDASNYHIVIIPKTNLARKKINKINSRAHKEGFYYKPRIFLEDLLTLDKNDVIITTACVAGFVKNEKGMEEIFMPLYKHFGKNLFLEVQSHNHINQIKHNEKIIDLQQKYGLNIISANDSHYIYPQDASKRELLLSGKHIKYDDEGGFILDYPDTDTLVERYRSQGVLNEKQITEAIENTLVFDDFETIDINKESKMPNIYPELTEEERYNKLEKLTWDNFYNMIVPEDKITEEDLPKYKEKMAHCLKVVKDTMEMQTQDYFLLDEKLVNLAIDKYGGVLTRSSRGSAGAFYLNRVLNLTQLDSDTTDIPMYPDRFMSVARTLENRSYPDLDLNVVDQEPFVKASKELLGEFGCYPMVAYGTMGLSESFRNVCRSKGMEFDEFNEVGKEIEKHENDTKWKSYIDEAKELVGTVVSASIHPCSYLLFSGDIEHELGVIRVGKAICTPITSNESDDWKYLKNDYLIVSVWEIISKVFERIGIPIMSLKELRESVDEKTWDIYSKGLTCTVNQVDSDWGTSLAKRYKPKSIDEVAMLTAAIRPSFDAWRDSFINREDFTNHNKYMDDLLKSTNKYILFQENLMQYFEWLGISPAESIGLIKKISKKKIKKEDFDKLVDRIKEAWVQQTGNIEGFYENWEMIQNCMAYSFNSPHAIGYGYDSVYCAYLKSHYPLEYYSVVLNIYQDDQVRTSKLIGEMAYFKISLKNIQFGFSKGDYGFDKETNSIYKGIKSIKFMNSNISDELYALSSNKYKYFVDLLKDIADRTSVNSRQLEILIKLDYFREFGNSKLLWTINKKFVELKQGEANVFKQENVNEDQISFFGVMPKSLSEKYKSDPLISMICKKYEFTEKTSGCMDILRECEEYYRCTVTDDFSIGEKIEVQNEYVGYVDFCTHKPEDRTRLLILDIFPLRSKKTNEVWANKLKTCSLGTGKPGEILVYEKVFQNNPLSKYDVINVNTESLTKKEWQGRTSWYLNYYNIEKEA